MRRVLPLLLLLAAFPVSSRAAGDTDGLVTQALAARQRKDYEGAIGLLQEALKGENGSRIELLLAQTLAWSGQFEEAGQHYRAILRKDETSHDAALGLAQVLAWQHRYRLAAAEYRRILLRHPADTEALKGLATVEYWSGDLRSASRDFHSVLRNTPGDADARQIVSEIEKSGRPVFSAGTTIVDDDQPYRRVISDVEYSFFSDPLTKWTASAGTQSLSATRLGLGSGNAPFAGLAVDVPLPAPGMRAAGSLRFLRFPDSTTRPLGSVTLAREWSTQTLCAGLSRDELLYTASSVLAHPTVDAATIDWKRMSRRSMSAAAFRLFRYFDGNHGRGADAYHLVRVGEGKNFSVDLGASGAWRDTDETRFHLVGASAASAGNGLYEYSYSARYDPYWTPRNLREARAIVAASIRLPRGTLKLHADGGYGRDRDLVFGPSSGTAPLPPLFMAPLPVDRTFHPWRSSADLIIPIPGLADFNLGVEHQTTVFYSVNTWHASLTRHF
jgi:hypothetical protein